MSLFIRSRNQTASLISTLVLGAFAVAYVVLSYEYEPKVRAFPLIVGWSMVIFVVLDLLCHTNTALGRVVAALVGMDKPPADTAGASDASPVGALMWIPAYGVMVYLIGFLPTAGLYMFVSTAIFGSTRPLRAALWSVALVAVLYAFFEWALGFRLFDGVVLGPLLD